MSISFLLSQMLSRFLLLGIIIFNILLIGFVLRNLYLKRKAFLKNIKRQG